MKYIACAFLDNSHTVVPVSYSSLYNLYISAPLLSYILLRLVKHPPPPLPISFYYTLHIQSVSRF